MDWQRLQVAPDGTHHVHRGAPAYPQRFEQVLKFHSPGLAPVRANGLAWHIGANGEPAYPRRFLQTFGFYGGFAAVRDSAGWFHIDPVGDAVYPEKHAWCGNFQEGLCPVRLIGGRYTHIQPDGKPVTGNTWAYAGDYRDGIAVVQRDDGLSSHIDLKGELVHDQWFLDLDVFHKGFARARDAAGWFHLNRSGSPAYQRRFEMVEPFYNGQARVETHEGSLEVVDGRGKTVLQLRPRRASEVEAGTVLGDLAGTAGLELFLHPSVGESVITGGAAASDLETIDEICRSVGAGWHLGPGTLYVNGPHGETLDRRLRVTYAASTGDTQRARSTLWLVVRAVARADAGAKVSWTSASQCEVEALAVAHAEALAIHQVPLMPR